MKKGTGIGNLAGGLMPGVSLASEPNPWGISPLELTLIYQICRGYTPEQALRRYLIGEITSETISYMQARVEAWGKKAHSTKLDRDTHPRVKQAASQVSEGAKPELSPDPEAWESLIRQDPLIRGEEWVSGQEFLLTVLYRSSNGSKPETTSVKAREPRPDPPPKANPAPKGSQRRKAWTRIEPRKEVLIDPENFPGLNAEQLTVLKCRLLDGLTISQTADYIYEQGATYGSRHRVEKGFRDGIEAIKANQEIGFDNFSELIRKIVEKVLDPSPKVPT